ncbi:hypothetical protein PInf_011523 [Phytophthora infestans]|nr:hypothetical protein PInf_011523 [Phytophthora infestans]
MRSRDGSPRRRGPGLSNVTRAGDTDAALSAEQASTGQGDKETGAVSDVDDSHEEPGFSDVVNDGEDMDVENEGKVVDVENDDEGADVDNDAEEAYQDEASEDGEISVYVDAPSTWHADWNAWQAYYALYCKRTMQVLPVKETMSRSERNSVTGLGWQLALTT